MLSEDHDRAPAGKPDEEPAPQGLLSAEPTVKFNGFLEEQLQVNSTLTGHDFYTVLELPFLILIKNECPTENTSNRNI